MRLEAGEEGELELVQMESRGQQGLKRKEFGGLE